MQITIKRRGDARCRRVGVGVLINDQTSLLHDSTRTHFLGKLLYADYKCLLQVSAAHVYLTYPFVLSWSMLEAMASGCFVIGSDTAPVRELLKESHNGRLVDFLIDQHISTAAMDAVGESAERIQMHQHAKQPAQDQYSRERGLQLFTGLGLPKSQQAMAPIGVGSLGESAPRAVTHGYREVESCLSA